MAQEETQLQYEYWKLNREKDVDIFHDSISGVTLTCIQVIRITQGAADFSSRFVQAKQFGHIIPATEQDYDAWVQIKWDMDHPQPIAEERPVPTPKPVATPVATPVAMTAEELLDLTKPQLLDVIKADKAITKATYNEWAKLSSEEIVPLYMAALNP